MKCLLIASQMAIVLLFLSRDLLAEEVPIRNNFVEPIDLWSLPEATKQWLRPALYIPRRGTRNLNIDIPGRYYVVVRDQAKRDEHLGLVDLHEYARKYPGDAVVIDGILEQRSATVVVRKYRLEERTTVCYGRRQSFVVRVPYDENVERVYNVWIPYLELPSGKKLMPLSR